MIPYNIFVEITLILIHTLKLYIFLYLQLEEVGYVVMDDFLDEEEVAEVIAAGRALSMDAPQEGRKVFSTINAAGAQNKENYFIESGDKVRYFFEENALGEKGELLVDPTLALNKVGHALHTEHPIFEKITFSDRIKEICWQLGFRKPAVPQSMYIYKNPGVGGEGNFENAFNRL